VGSPRERRCHGAALMLGYRQRSLTLRSRPRPECRRR
jgi:hypothetical protein